MPGPGKLKIWCCIFLLPSSGSKTILSLPELGIIVSVALYWSPNACRPITIGLVHPGTNRGTFFAIIGCLNTVPPRIFLIVPLGDRYISLRLNSLTLSSSGVIVAHLTPTPYCLIALAASTVTLSVVLSLYSIPRSKYFKSISKYGKINFSLIIFHMILVISSPSISTNGFLTLILFIVFPFKIIT